MSNFIKLTNNFDKLKGNIMHINADHIVAVFSEVGSDGMSRTFVYGGPTGTTWDVEESVSEVMAKIKDVQQSRI